MGNAMKWLAATLALGASGCTPPAVGIDGGDGGVDGGSSDAGDAGVIDAGPRDAGPADLDFAIVRFNADGTLDSTFADGGIARVDLGVGAGTLRDTLWGISRDSTDRLVLFGHTKAAGRADLDRTVFRLTANGALDTTFGTQGVHRLDLGNLSDNSRHGFVQPDGKIISTGYTPQPSGVGTQSIARIVILRLDANGAPDPTFGDGGVVNSAPFASMSPTVEWGLTESYAVGLQNNRYISGGYGYSTLTPKTQNQIAFRYSTSGVLDPTWGTAGTFELDLVGNDDRVRHLQVLNDDRVLLVGSGSPAANQVRAMVTMLTPNGVLDTTFNTTGYKLFNFNRPEDAFFGVALSPTGSVVAAVGHRTGGGEDDDSTLLLLPVTAGAPAEFAQAVPTSETGNDRFFNVAFDSTGKAVAVGYVVEAGDSKMVVARFNTDGSRDTTFGTGGIVIVNVSVGRTDETARGVVIQSNGKIVIAGVADH